MAAFKDMLKYLRTREKLSQAELASKLGVAKSTISMYEVGNREPDFKTLEAIADLFHVDMNFLLGRDGTEYKYDKAAGHSEPSYEDVAQLIARNGKKMSAEDKLKLIKLLSEIDD